MNKQLDNSSPKLRSIKFGSRSFLSFFCAAILCVLCSLSLKFFLQNSVEIEVVAPKGGIFQIFWRKPGQSFSESQSTAFNLKASNKTISYFSGLDAPWIDIVRIDPLNIPSRIDIKKITINSGFFSRVFSGETLQKALTSPNQIERIERHTDRVSITSNGNDSQVLLEKSVAALTPNRLFLFPVLAILMGYIFFMMRRSTAFLAPIIERSAHEDLQNLCLHKIVLSAVAFGFLISVACNFNGSSIHAWHRHYPALFNLNDKPLIGQPRAIRSDEWLVHTPGIVSQSAMNESFSPKNKNYGSGLSPLLMGLPTDHLSTAFRPQYWGFFFFDAERAFSWWWNFRVFVCILGVYLLLFFLTSGQSLLSISCSLWFFCSAFVQWWLSSGVPELVGNFSLSLFSLLVLISSKQRLYILLSGLALCIFSISFIVQLYPPFQIPLCWLGITIVVGLCFSKNFRENFKLNKKLKIAVLILCSLVIAFILFKFAIDIRESARVLSSTSYPGIRFERGGNYSISRLFSGFGLHSISEKAIPEGFGNISEGSSFVLLWPLALLCLPIYRRPLFLALGIYLLMLSSFVCIGWPLWLAKTSFMSMVPSARALLGLGLANVVFVALALTSLTKIKPIIAYLRLSLVAALSFAWIFLTELEFGSFFNHPQYILSFCVMMALGSFVVLKSRNAFCFAITAFSLPTLISVNPVVVGLNTLLDNKVSHLRKEIDPVLLNKTFLIYGDFILPELFKAAGFITISGTNYIPDLDFWSNFDSENEYRDVYNRFAHFQFSLRENPEDFDMKLVQADLVEVGISPCNAKLQKQKIDAFVMPTQDESRKPSCLNKINSSLDKVGLSIYLFQSPN